MFQHSSMQKHVGQDTGVTGCVSLLSKAAFASLQQLIHTNLTALRLGRVWWDASGLGPAAGAGLDIRI